MTSGVVARSDAVYKAVPDLARAADGTLVCYRVSRDDWILYPEGELPRIEKVDPPASEMHRYDRGRNVIYHDAALALSARRFKEQP